MQTLRTFKDQTGSLIKTPWPPSRIISLVPSQTELLCDLNLSDQLVAITKYCVWPTQWKNAKVIIGGTKSFDVKKILELSPDLVLGNKEENQKELVEQLLRSVPVWMSDIKSLNDAAKMIKEVGIITNREHEAEVIANKIDKSFEDFVSPVKAQKSILYLIWRKPWMGVGSGTFINDVLNRIGYQNCLADEERYPVLDSNKLMTIRPDHIFLSSEPYPFKEKHKDEINQLFPMSTVSVVDGQMFSWYGSRLLKAVDYFKSLTV